MVNDDGYCVVNDGYSNNNLVGGKTTILKKIYTYLYIHILHIRYISSCISTIYIYILF